METGLRKHSEAKNAKQPASTNGACKLSADRVCINVTTADMLHPSMMTLGIPDIDIGSSCPHGCACYKTPFDQLVRVMPHDLSIFACAWLRLISIDDDVRWPAIRNLRNVNTTLMKVTSLPI